MKPFVDECKRLILAFGYSWAGLKAAFASEAAFRVEVCAAILLIPLACWLDTTSLRRAALIGSVLLVLICELVNTAIETVFDRVGNDPHPATKKAKDIGSAVVLMALANAGVVWWMVAL